MYSVTTLIYRMLTRVERKSDGRGMTVPPLPEGDKVRLTKFMQQKPSTVVRVLLISFAMFAFFYQSQGRPAAFFVNSMQPLSNVRRCTKNAFHNLGEKAKHHLYLFQLFKFKTESDIKRSAVDLISAKNKIESQGVIFREFEKFELPPVPVMERLSNVFFPFLSHSFQQ